MTRDQVARLYSECNDWLLPFVAIALNTGLRHREILALEWDDIDLDSQKIKVRSDNSFTTKGKRNRVIPISVFLQGVLKKAPKHITCPYIIFTKQGDSPWPTGVRSMFKRALKRAGLPVSFRVHDLRHTFATTLAANGVDIVTIKNLLGHTDIQTTMKYLHAAPDRNKWAVENLHLDGKTQAEFEKINERKVSQMSAKG